MDLVLFILGVVIVICGIALVLAVKSRKALATKLKNNNTNNGEEKAFSLESQARGLMLGAVGSFIAAAICILLSMTAFVPAKTVGVLVEFGSPKASLPNGIHWKAPWASVEKLDGTLQTDTYANESSISVRLGNNSIAHADASIQWQLIPGDTEEIFINNQSFEKIQLNIIDRNFRAALNEVMAGYNPLDAVDPAKGGSDLKSLSESVYKSMIEKVDGKVRIESVVIPIIKFDESTQTRIDELQSEIAKTKIAQQRKETATADAAANQELERALSMEILVSKCLDIISESGHAPIGCFPGSDVTNINSLNTPAG